MKREAKLTTDVKAKARAIRDRFGDTEYSREDIIEDVIETLKASPVDVDQMYRARAHALLDDFDKADDDRSSGQGDMFPGSAHVALGDNRRIKRDKMKLEHLLRRRRLIDDQYNSHHDRWKAESTHLNEFLPVLMENPDLTVGDVRPSSEDAS